MPIMVCYTSVVRCSSLQPGHYSSLTAPNLQHTANQERNGQSGNQHHSRELLMMGVVMPETCWAYKKYNKIISAVYLSQYLTNLMHKICFTISFISCLYMFRAHVLIIKRSKLHYTASGIMPPIYVWWYQKLCNAVLTSWWWAHVLETCRGVR